MTPNASVDADGSRSGEFRGSERFSVVRRLGAGGMGVVYEALDVEHGVSVALKTLRQLDPTAIYHLKQEFRALADVRHRNLVRLHELVAVDGQWFFTMELVDGVDFLRWVRREDRTLVQETVDAESLESLSERASPRAVPSGLRVSPGLDVRRLRDALVQLVEGVQALHAIGKLHRDIKPSNIVVTREGRVVLLDFGLATDVVRDGTLHSVDQNVLGTPEYMSPEQGALRTLGPASDWYSVGVVLFEALTGGLPFVGSPLEILMRKEREDGPSPGSLVEGLPEDLDALCTALLRRDPDARPNAQEILARLGKSDSQRGSVPPPSLRPTNQASPLVGRERHLDLLARAFRRSRQGRAVAVHLHGPGGVGKSALVRRFLEDAASRHQALVLSASCYERESVPYKALDSAIDALSRHLRRLSRLEAEALLPRDVHALARLFPVLERVEAIASAPRVGSESPDPAELRRRAFAALREMFARIADRRPLIVAIDDLQWGDLDSVALLADVLRPPYPPPMLLIASYRDDSADGNPTLRALQEMHAGNEAPEDHFLPTFPIFDVRASNTAKQRRRSTSCEAHDLVLEPLDGGDARALARLLLEGLMDDERVEAIAHEAAGNPFLIQEYARWLRERPDVTRAISLEEMIDARLRPLSGPARRFIEVLSVAARPIAPQIALHAADAEDDRDLLDSLRAAHLVRTARVGDSDVVETWHDRVREAVLARLGPREHADAHLRLANAIESSSTDDPESLALHFRGAGAKWKASHYAALAARRAEAALAFDRAAELHKLAIELAPPNAPELRTYRLARGDALANAGRGLEAAREYLEAARGSVDEDTLELQRRAAQHLLQSGHVDQGIAVFEGVLGAIGERLPSSPRRAFASLLLRRVQLRLRGLDYVERSADEVPRDELVRIDALWALCTGFGLVDVIAGADFGTRHLLAALRAGEPHRLVRAFCAETVFSAARGASSRERTKHLAKRTRALAGRVGTPVAQGLAAAAEAFKEFHLGHWRVARERFRRSERIFRESCTGVAWELANVRHFHASCLANLGELRRLSERMPALLEEAASRGDLLAQTTLRVGASSILWLAHDDPDGGRRDVLDAVQRWSRRGFLLQHYYELSSLAHFDLYAGRPEEAHRRVVERWNDLERSMLLRMQRVRIDAFALRARTALAAARVSPTDALSLRRDAERMATRIEKEERPWALPLAFVVRAALARAAHDEASAVAWLGRAVRGFEAADMRLLAHATRRKLGALRGGEEGRAMIAAADVFMASEDVQDPARLTETLIPDA